MLSPELFTTEIVASFLTLTFLELVLAGDNLVLIAILAGKLPPEQRPFARRLGLIAAVVTRLLLLFSLFWLSHLERAIPLPGNPGFEVTPRQIVLGLGGLFLIWKSFAEISRIFFSHAPKLEARGVRAWADTFAGTIVQIAFFDLIFSLDSVIAAIGIAKHVEVMAAAVITAALLMLFLVNPISNFIDRHPVVRLVALNFLTLVGALLVAEALHLKVPHTYFYIALAVAVVIQVLFLWIRSLGRTARVSLGLLVIVASLGLVLGAILYMDNDDATRHQAIATLNNVIESGRTVFASAVEWFRALVT